MTAQFERSIDKRIDIPPLHVDFTVIGHGRLNTESDAMRKILDGVSAFGFPVRTELVNCGSKLDKAVGTLTRV